MFEKKNLFLIIFGVAVLMAGFWLVQTPKAKATDYKFIEVNLDTDKTVCISCALGDCDHLYGFHGINSFPHINSGIGWSDILNLPATPTPRAGYHCGIWIIEDESVNDWTHILWAEKGKRLSKSGTSLIGDLGAQGADWDWCAGCLWNVASGDCRIYTTGTSTTLCDGDLTDGIGTDGLIAHPYGNMDCKTSTAVDIALSVGGASNTYQPEYDILCADTNTWKTCEANSCVTVGTDNWACNGGTGVWEKCASICLNGACEAASGALFLTISADPLIIEVNGTSTITFLVTKEGNPVELATVENITATGGFVSVTFCATGADGKCAVIYTAPPIAGLYGVNAAKATKLGETDSASAGVVIKVLSLPIAPCGPEIGVLCNPVDNASDFYDVIVIAIKYLLSLIALITLLFIVISGIKYLTSFGNEEKMRSAKDGLASAVFGLILVLAAYAILEVIIKVLSS